MNYSNPIELNRYGYAAGNPVNLSDPIGLFAMGYADTYRPAIGSMAALKGLAVFVTATFVIGAVVFLVAQDIVDAPPAPDRLKPFEDWFATRYPNGLPGGSPDPSPGGTSLLGKILRIIAITILVGQFILVAVDTGRQPTEKPPFIIRHFTSRDGLKGIRAQGYTIIPTYQAFPGGRDAIFFTDTSPFRGGFDRYLIAGTLGIDIEKTESFIDIDRNKVGDPKNWHSRLLNGRMEYFYLTNLPLSVASGYIREGDTSDLP